MRRGWMFPGEKCDRLSLAREKSRRPSSTSEQGLVHESEAGGFNVNVVCSLR
jgi:hypothetical protein